MNYCLKGQFNLTLKKADGTIKQQTTFDNLILNSGLDLLGTNSLSSVIYNLHFGAGNTEPNIEQVNLSSWLGMVSSSTFNLKKVAKIDEDVKYHLLTQTYRIPTGREYNIAEIGVSNKNQQSSPLFCRTLVKDSAGRPTVITKLADEILEVSYTLQVIIPTQDFTGTCLIGGEEYYYTARSANIDYVKDSTNNSEYSSHDVYSSPIVAITSSPSSNGQSKNSYSIAPYQVGTYRKELSIIFGIDRGNFSTGIRSLVYEGFSSNVQVEYRKVSDGSAIPKDNTKALTLRVGYSWGRADVT